MTHEKKFVMSFSVLIILYLLFSSKHNLLPVFSVSNTTKDKLENELIVALFFKDIDSAVQSYYSKLPTNTRQ